MNLHLKEIKMHNKRKVTSSEIHNELLNIFKIKHQIGSVEIKLGNISAKYNGKDAIGDLLQEWLGKWFDSMNYFYRTKPNSQEFPDFLLSDRDDEGHLEIKTFNADASPAFDIANFDSYCTSLLDFPERLDADYLILSYKMVASELRIDNVWLKKVWEISSPSGPNDIKVQTKRGQIYNIRPCTWYSNKLKFQPFVSKLDFLNALAKTQQHYPQCNIYKNNWAQRVKDKYLKKTSAKL